MNRKPKWVYKAKSGDYSQCKMCYNFGSMTKALLRRLNAKDAHLINSVLCPNHDWYAMDCDECSCDECWHCNETLEALSRSPLRLLQHLCCVNGSEHPDLQCINGYCSQSECGIFKVERLLRSQLIKIPDEDDIGFKQIRPMERMVKGKKQKCHANVYVTMAWSEFIVFYIDYLNKFMVHYNSWIFQHQTRRDFVDLKFGRIPIDSIYCHLSIPIQ